MVVKKEKKKEPDMWQRFEMDTHMGIQNSEQMIKNTAELLEFQKFILSKLQEKNAKDNDK